MLPLLLIPFLLLTASHTRSDHALYLSVLEIDKQQMKVKVFIDDLQDAIKYDSDSPIQSDEERFLLINRPLIQEYFQKKIQLQVNEQRVDFNLDKTSTEGGSYWVSFTLESPEKWQSLSLKASYLMELFPDQTNVVKILGEELHFFKLTKNNTSCSLTF